MKKILCFITLCLTISLFAVEKFKPSNAGQKAYVVKAVKLSRTNPLWPPNTVAQDLSLITIHESSNIKPIIDTGILINFLKDMGGKEYKYHEWFLKHFVLECSGYIIENEGKFNTDKCYLQALEGCIIGYQNMVKEEPKAKNAHFDKLVILKDEKKLAEYLIKLGKGTTEPVKEK